MKTEWWIQTNIDDVDTSGMIAEVRKQDMEVVPLEFSGVDRISLPQTTAWPVVCYGSIDLVRHVRKNAPWVPGAYCDFDNMKCSTYYAHLGGHLLNKHYLMMPIGDLLRKWDNLAVSVPLFNDKELAFMKPTMVSESCGSVFVRPDSGTKPFTGQVISDCNELEQIIQRIGQEELVVVSTPKEITMEWRFVVCQGNVVTGSQYLPEEHMNIPICVWRFAQQIASESWQPDMCYTMDICKHRDGLYLLEINSFSCAGLYQCYMPNVVKAVSRAAMNEWSEYYEQNI